VGLYSSCFTYIPDVTHKRFPISLITVMDTEPVVNTESIIIDPFVMNQIKIDTFTPALSLLNTLQSAPFIFVLVFLHSIFVPFMFKTQTGASFRGLISKGGLPLLLANLTLGLGGGALVTLLSGEGPLGIFVNNVTIPVYVTA
jgi:hypothetical protein